MEECLEAIESHTRLTPNSPSVWMPGNLVPLQSTLLLVDDVGRHAVRIFHVT